MLALQTPQRTGGVLPPLMWSREANASLVSERLTTRLLQVNLGLDMWRVTVMASGSGVHGGVLCLASLVCEEPDGTLRKVFQKVE
ncbi:hypothetical protein V5799_023807 [Amblyomma americanum]|uniref:Uncharacterized protein n=1 Tax=Amblyomma americanum TaxID=6943 RepID=A0AAQ4FHJ3_AMBAM